MAPADRLRRMLRLQRYRRGLTRRETVTHVFLQGPWPLRHLERLARRGETAWEGLFALFEGVLEVKAELSGGVTWTANAARCELAKLRELVEAADPGASVDVTATVDKQNLIAALQPQGILPVPPAWVRQVFYFQGASLVGDLERYDRELYDAPRKFEEGFLGVREDQQDLVACDRALRILVADTDGALHGPFLEVLGRDRLPGPADGAARTAPPRFARLADVQTVLRTRMWDRRPRTLTPDFLEIAEAVGDGLQPCRGELQRLQNQLVLPTLANHTLQKGRHSFSAFKGDRTVEVQVDESGEERGQSLFPLYQWACQDLESDRAGWPGEDPAKAVDTRLEIVRRVIATRLPPGPQGNLAELVKRRQELHDACEVQLKLLVNQNIAESFKRMREVHETVRTYVDGVGANIRSLSAEAVDNAYKTVGFLVGLVIAYLLEPSKSLTVFLLGAILYIVYILFIRFFYLGSIEQDFDAKQAEFGKSWGKIKASGLFHSGEIGELATAVSGREAAFKARLCAVKGIYLGLAGVTVVALLGWLAYRSQPPDLRFERRQALDRHATLLAGSGCQDVRLAMEGRPAPLPVVVPGTGENLVPDLTCVAQDAAGTLYVAEYVPCARIGQPPGLARLRGLRAALAGRRSELHLLTPAVCGDRPGPDRVRAWLAGDPDLASAVIWAS